MDYNENTTEVLPKLDGENAKELAEAIAEVLDSKKGRDNRRRGYIIYGAVP